MGKNNGLQKNSPIADLCSKHGTGDRLHQSRDQRNGRETRCSGFGL